MAVSSSLLQALTITLSSRYVSNSTRATAATTCAALRQPAASQTWCQHQSARPARPQRRQSTKHGLETQALAGTRAVPKLDGSGSDGGNTSSVWQAVAASLDRKQPQAAWTEFVRVLEQGAVPPGELCDRLISALCAAQHFRDAWRVYAAVQASGYCLQYNTYQALISQALKVGALESALEAFRDLQAAGRTPNVVTYCGLISALGRERRRGLRFGAVAAELWAELEGSGAQLDAAAYRTGIKALVDVNRLKDADRLLQRMAGAGAAPDVRAYNILLSGYARAANANAMARLMRRMVGAGVEPSAVTFNTLIDGHVRAGDMAAARRVLGRAADAGVALDAWTYSTLIKGCVQEGKLAAAETVLGDMVAAGLRPNCVTFTTLIDGHVRAGDMAAAQRVLDAMLAAGEAPNAVTYNTLLRGYAATAAQAAAAMEAGSSDDEQSGAAPAAGDVQQPAGSGGKPSAAGQDPALGAATRLLADMQARGVNPTADTFNTLMAAAVSAGEAALAVRLHERMRRAGLRPDALTYTTLIKAHGRLGRVADAAAAFEALLRDRSAAPDLRAYNAMVDVLARNGDMADAERMLTVACDWAAKQGLPPPVEAFGAVVAGYARQKAVASAAAVVRRFHAAGGSPDAQMLDLLASLAIRAGEYKVAMQSVRALELIGRDVDKGRYAALLEEVRARGAEGGDGAVPERGHNRTWEAYQRRREARRRNVQLERFKFWLGLPNRYYESDNEQGSFDELDEEPPRRSGGGKRQ